MLTKLFSGLVVATGVVAASVAGLNTSATRWNPSSRGSDLLLERVLQRLPELQLRMRLLQGLHQRLRMPQHGQVTQQH